MSPWSTSISPTLSAWPARLPLPAGSACAIYTDVSDEAQVAKMAASVIGRFGRVDVLVNNAGVAGAAEPFPELTLESWNAPDLCSFSLPRV